MPSLSAPGIGSGLDVNGIVSQLLQLEQRPLLAIQERQQEFRSQLSAFGQLKSALSGFQDSMKGLSELSKFKTFTASSSDEGVFTVSADSSAGGGNFSLVVSQLAERQKLASSPFVSADATVGAGSLAIDVGGQSFNVAVDASNDTLNGIRDAVNNAADNTGVIASIINEDAGSRLIFTSENTGTSNTVTVTVSGASGTLAQLDSANLSEIQAAKDATLTVDGFAVTSASNSVKDVIEGVTLDLKATGSATVDIERDDKAIAENIQGFADAYNNLRSKIDGLQTGALGNDSSLRSIENRLRGIINVPAGGLAGGFSTLNDIGVSLQKDGTLQVDSSKLTDALNDNLSGVAELFTNDDQGFAFRFEALAGQFLEDKGLVSGREEGLNSRIDDLGKQEERVNRRLDSVESNLRKRFSALDSLLGQLQATGSFLSSQLASLPQIGGRN